MEEELIKKNLFLNSMIISDLTAIAESFIGKGKVSIVERELEDFIRIAENYLDMTLKKILKFYGGKNILAFV